MHAAAQRKPGVDACSTCSGPDRGETESGTEGGTSGGDGSGSKRGSGGTGGEVVIPRAPTLTLSRPPPRPPTSTPPQWTPPSWWRPSVPSWTPEVAPSPPQRLESLQPRSEQPGATTVEDTVAPAGPTTPEVEAGRSRAPDDSAPRAATRIRSWVRAARSKVRTTISEPSAPRPPDLVDRNFRVERPDALYVADFTYVRMVPCFAYTAFVIDAFAGTIVGWEVSTSKETAFVQRAVNQACMLHSMHGNPLRERTIHHSDAGSQYTAFWFGETLFLQGIRPSIGSVADAYDDALAETTIGLYKTECIADDSPFREGPLRTISDVEEAAFAWVHWYNTGRLMHRLGRIPPAEYEARYYAEHRADQPVAHK
nr:IS3 family transposase [Rhodococcus pyridinivorans]